MRQLVFVLLLTGACIESQLVPCGDLACPVGDVCLRPINRCVAPAQLALCDGLAEDDPCTLGALPGRCRDGACTAALCGNGIIDVGERCDDGNTISGDGCGGTCQSDESCGNGVVDVALGEGCDCGVADQLNELCDGPNTADPGGVCDLACQPRFCGDGEINTIESCDGGPPQGESCSDYGFYRGALTCSQCQVAVDDCAGRCGDGVIDSANGEYCDGELPDGANCVQFGYDFGQIDCGIGCGASFNTCAQFGWARAHSVTSQVLASWGGSGRIAVVYATNDAYVLDGGTWYQAPAGTYTKIVGSEASVWAIGATHLARYTTVAGWVAVAVPWAAGTNVASAWVSDTLGLFVSHVGDAELSRWLGGTWSVVTGAWGNAPTLQRTRSFLWLSQGATQLWFDGASWEPFSEAIAIGTVIEDDTGTLWSAQFGEIWRRRVGEVTWSLLPGYPGGVGYVPTRGGIIANICDGGAGQVFEDMWVIAQPPMSFPGEGCGVFVSDETGRIFRSGYTGLYEYLGGKWVAPYSPGGGYLVQLGGGPPVTITPQPQVLDESGEQVPLAMPRDQCVLAGLSPQGSLLAGCGVYYDGNDYVVDAPGGLFEDGTLVVSGLYVTTMWSHAEGTEAAASGLVLGTGASFSWRPGPALDWQTMPTPSFEVSRLAGDRLDELYAIVSLTVEPYGNALYRFDGAEWNLVEDNVDSTTLIVTPTRVYVSSGGLVVVSRATQQVIAVDLPPGAVLATGTGGEELFIMGQASDRGSRLYHYEGTTGIWRPVRLPPNSTLPEYFMYSLGRNPVIAFLQGAAERYVMLQRTGPLD